MKWSAVFLALVAAGPAAIIADPVTAGARAQADPDPNEVWIGGATYDGSGCPEGSATISLAEDRKSFTVIMDSYIAEVGPGQSPSEGRKNCRLNIQLHYPGGFEFSIFSSAYRGYLELDGGVRGTQKATYYFSGSTAQTSTATTYTGPISQDYLTHDEIPPSSTIWSPCGELAALNINSQVRMDNSKATRGAGIMTTDSIDGKVTLKVGVEWWRCL